MKKTLKKMSNTTKLFILHGIGFVAVCFYGAIAHDLAKLSPNFFTYMIFPANLSLWEQGKLLMTGMSLWFLLEYFLIGRKIKGFVFIHTVVSAALPILMLLIYMTHSQFFGDLSLEGAHIVLSVALILGGFMASAIMVSNSKDYSGLAPYGIVFYVVLALLYAVFTFLPPETAMFRDAVHNTSGPFWTPK